MKELTIGPGDKASLSMGTLIEGHGGGHCRGPRGEGAENSENGRLSLQGPAGEPVELLTEYFWRAPDREHLSLWELCKGSPFLRIRNDMGGGLRGRTSSHGGPLTGNSERLL